MPVYLKCPKFGIKRGANFHFITVSSYNGFDRITVYTASSLFSATHLLAPVILVKFWWGHPHSEGGAQFPWCRKIDDLYQYLAIY